MENLSRMLEPPVKTPCIGVCSTGIGDNVCRGCKRFEHEVINWNNYSAEQKRIVDRRLSGFLASCVKNRVKITDAKLLQWQLQVQQIQYNQAHDEYCWVFALLKAGAKQIQLSGDYGFEVNLDYRAMPLRQLREEIDREFFALSQAHYERYMMVPDLFTPSKL